MKEKDKELIREVSNSEFPLDAFMNDIEHLRFEQPGNPALEAYDFDFMEEDIIKMAETLKHFEDEFFEVHEVDGEEFRKTLNGMKECKTIW